MKVTKGLSTNPTVFSVHQHAFGSRREGLEASARITPSNGRCPWHRFGTECSLKSLPTLTIL